MRNPIPEPITPRPSSTPLRNTLPGVLASAPQKLPTVQKNVTPLSTVKEATTAQTKETRDALQKMLLGELDALKRTLGKVFVDQQAFEQRYGSLAQNGALPTDKFKELITLMNQGKFAEARNILNSIDGQKFGNEKAAAIADLQRAELSSQWSRVNDLVNHGAPAAEIKNATVTLIKEIHDLMRTDGLAGKTIDPKALAPVFSHITKEWDAYAGVDERLRSTNPGSGGGQFTPAPSFPTPPNGSTSPGGGSPPRGGFTPGGGFCNNGCGFWTPTGHCWIVCNPQLPRTDICWVCNGVYLCGTGGVGQCGLWGGTPACFGLSVPTCGPIPNLIPGPAFAQDLVVLINPAESGATVQYIIGDQSGAIESEQIQSAADGTVVITFDRGGDFGEAKYTLAPGSYKFIITDQGWDLRKTTFQVVLDNSANANDFHVQVGGEDVTIPAQLPQYLESPYPIVASFDNGSGGDPVQKSLENGQTYTIGVDSQTGLWDLFPGDANSTGAGSANAATLVADLGSNNGNPVPADDPAGTSAGSSSGETTATSVSETPTDQPTSAGNGAAADSP